MAALNLPTIFDVLLSLTYVFFIVSLFVSGIWEFISTILRDKRTTLLQESLRQLLSDPNFADLVYEHPLIQGQIVQRKLQFLERVFWRFLHREIDPTTKDVVLRPSYIDPNVFARILLGLIQQHVAVPALPPNPVPVLLQNNLQQVNQWVGALRTSSLNLKPEALLELQAILMALLQDADALNGGVAKAITSIEKWYSAYMDRVSGQFKQYSQQGIRWVAIVVVVAFNLDALHLTARLYSDPALRELTVGQARAVVKTVGDTINVTLAHRSVAEQAIRRQFKIDLASRKNAPADTIRQLTNRRNSTLAGINRKAKTKQDSLEQQRTVLAAEALGLQQLPVGWATFWQDVKNPANGGCYWFIAKMLAGWVLMVAAVSFGAPFWFDLLVKLVNIRNVGNKPESDKIRKI